MKDPELYDFFRKGSEAFDEMPPTGLWDKIDAGLKKGKKAKPVKSLLIQALLFLAVAALVLWICLQFAKKTLPLENQMKNNHPVEENKIYTSGTLIKHDSLKEVLTTLKTPELKMPENKDTPYPEDVNAVDEFDTDAQTDAKLAEFYTPEVTNQETAEVATTTTFKGRIVVRTTKKLTDSQYDLLIASALEENKGKYGLMLILFAPGHPTYRKVISCNKLDVQTTVRKIVQDSLKPQGLHPIFSPN